MQKEGAIPCIKDSFLAAFCATAVSYGDCYEQIK